MKQLNLAILFFLSVSALAQKDNCGGGAPTIWAQEGRRMSPRNSILSNLMVSPEMDMLAGIIKSADLSKQFQSDTITLFAPADQAFRRLPSGMIDTLLLVRHHAELAAVVSYHTVAGKLRPTDLLRMIQSGNGAATVRTIEGGTLHFRMNDSRNLVVTDENGRQSTAMRVNIPQSNGIMYIMDNVFLPRQLKKMGN